MTITDDLRAALHRRYTGGDERGERYVCIEEARSGAGFEGNNGACDFLAVNTWPGRGMELLGHELKVSTADWRKELTQPEKAERFARYCRRWWVVMPSELATKVRHEMPPAWGLLSLSNAGRLTELCPAHQREPEPVPEWWWVGWLAQMDRQTKRRVPEMVRAAMETERGRIAEAIEAGVQARIENPDRELEQLQTNAAALKAATGLELRHLYRHDLERLAALWRMAQGHEFDPARLASDLRTAADQLATLPTEEAPPT